MRLDALPDLTTVGNTAGSCASPLRTPGFRRPRPHHTSSGQLSGSRCCLSRGPHPPLRPQLMCECVSIQARADIVWAACVCFFFFLLKARTDKSNSTLKKDLVTSAWGGGGAEPANPSDSPERQGGGGLPDMWTDRKTKVPEDFWLMAFLLCRWTLPQK